MRYTINQKTAPASSVWLRSVIILGILAVGLLIYDVAQFKSLMLYVFTGVKI